MPLVASQLASTAREFQQLTIYLLVSLSLSLWLLMPQNQALRYALYQPFPPHLSLYPDYDVSEDFSNLPHSYLLVLIALIINPPLKM